MTATQPTQRVTRSSAAAATSVEQPKSVSAPKEGDVTAHLENEVSFDHVLPFEPPGIFALEAC